MDRLARLLAGGAAVMRDFAASHHRAGAGARARHLRGVMTLPEKLLWKELRRLDLHVRRRAPIGSYVVDFVSHAAALVIEIDGARHDFPEAQLHDLERTQWLVSQGYRVLRFRNDEVLADAPGVAEQIKVAKIEALPLDGGGLGGGADTVGDEGARKPSPAFLSSPQASAPPSPTLPSSRGKGGLTP